MPFLPAVRAVVTVILTLRRQRLALRRQIRRLRRRRGRRLLPRRRQRLRQLVLRQRRLHLSWGADFTRRLWLSRRRSPAILYRRTWMPSIRQAIPSTLRTPEFPPHWVRKENPRPAQPGVFIMGDVENDQATRSTSIFLISPIALAGLRPFGQTCAQFMMVWQR